MTRYIEQILADDEHILADTRLHWIIYFWPGFFTVITLGLALPITIFFLVGAFIRQFSSDFAVTDKRLVAKSGFIRRSTVEQRLNKIELIHVEQSIWGRLLGFGNVIVHGTGDSSSLFGPIAQPLDFKRAIEDAIEDFEANGGAGRR